MAGDLPKPWQTAEAISVVLTDERVILAQRGRTGFHADDLAVLEAGEGEDRFGSGAVGEVGDAVHHADLVVLVEDALVLAAHHVVADEADQVGLAHGHATDVRVEDEVVVNQFSNGFRVSAAPGVDVGLQESHDRP